MVFVCRPPSATPTGRYLGCAHLQRLLREPPPNLVAGVLDAELSRPGPEATLAEVTRYFATYDLVCAPVVNLPGTGRFLAAQSVIVLVWIKVNLAALRLTEPGPPESPASDRSGPGSLW